MPKCTSCRKLDSELDSTWDKIRLSLFHFFHNDITDLSQDKFTQGFSDGYLKGIEDEKKNSAQRMADYMAEVELPKPLVDLNKVLTEKSGKLYLNQVPIEPQKLADLKQEAHLLRNTSIWEIITNTIESQAFHAGWTQAKDLQDLMNGKAITYTVGVQKNIIKLIENSK